MTNAITLENVSKSYKDFKLDNISFSLPTGCILGLVGENGAGKTTIINLIMNSIKSDGGKITVLGKNSSGNAFPDLTNDIGIVLDEGCFPQIMPLETLNKMMSLTFSSWDEKRFFELVEIFGLPLGKQFKDFSRGMKMKASIAVALSHNAKLLVLDEPTSGLDPIIRDEIVDVFNNFTRDEEHSILISSHIISDLEKLCDYFAFIHNGKLKLFEEKDRLTENYGLVSCIKQEFELIPKEAIVGVQQNKYSTEALVLKNKTPSAFEIHRASVEDIILYMVKGEKNESTSL